MWVWIGGEEGEGEEADEGEGTYNLGQQNFLCLKMVLVLVTQFRCILPCPEYMGSSERKLEFILQLRDISEKLCDLELLKLQNFKFSWEESPTPPL